MLLLISGDWWSALSGTQQIFWGISIVFSVLFCIQFIFGLIGIDADADMEISGDMDMDMDMDMDGDYSLDADFTVFSTRSIIAFFTFFGWTGVASLNAGASLMTTLIASSISGSLAMAMVGVLMWQFSKLSQDGNIDINDALFQTGEVYLRIPPKDKGQGKVHINIQGSLKEVDAITESTEAIPTGAFIRVEEVLDNRLLVVSQVK